MSAPIMMRRGFERGVFRSTSLKEALINSPFGRVAIKATVCDWSN